MLHMPKVTQLFRVRSQTQPVSKLPSSALYQACSSKSLLYRWGTRDPETARHWPKVAHQLAVEQQPLVQRRERFHHVRGTPYITI